MKNWFEKLIQKNTSEKQQKQKKRCKKIKTKKSPRLISERKIEEIKD